MCFYLRAFAFTKGGVNTQHEMANNSEATCLSVHISADTLLGINDVNSVSLISEIIGRASILVN